MNSRGRSGGDPTLEDLVEGPTMVSAVVVNLRREAYDVYIGRGSKWGNPFKIGSAWPSGGSLAAERGSRGMSRGDVITAYRDWLLYSDKGVALQKDIGELQGQRLGCFCKPAACHGDILAWLANGYIETRR